MNIQFNKVLGLLFYISFMSFIADVNAQGIINSESEAKRLSPSEFSIPASPVFDLMGVTPSQVQ
jgi:hypothetical protein